MSTCKAYLRGQQYFCDHCGTTWDMDDSAPPCNPKVLNNEVVECSTPPRPPNRTFGNKALLKIKENLNNEKPT